MLALKIICACACVYTRVQYSWRPEEGVRSPLELELQELVSSPTWALGTKPGPTKRAVGTLHHGVIAPALGLC